MSKKDPLEVKIKETQGQLSSAHRRLRKLEEKVERLTEKLSSLRQQQRERGE